MNIIYHNLLRKKIIKEIERIGDGVCEILIDFELSFGAVNSLELDEPTGKVFIHTFVDNDFDICLDLDDLDESDKLIIIETLKTI